MTEYSPENINTKADQEQKLEKQNSLDIAPHLDITKLMSEKNCYFIHMLQVTKNLDVSENNKNIDTKKLSVADKLDILYAANPTLSTSSLRPNSQDGTFYGGFGVLFSGGEMVSANPNDDGTIANSINEREIIGGAKNSPEDIDKAIDRKNEGYGKSYNEIVLKNPQVASGFMKIDGEAYKNRISYEESISDYGSGGEETVKKNGVLDMANERGGAVFDTPFSVLLEMKSRGPVYFLDENNHMLIVNDIDEKTRKIRFSTVVTTPKDIVEIYSSQKLNKYTRIEMLDRLSSKGINLS